MSIPLFGWISARLELSEWVSLFYLPAGVVLIALLLAGQSAAIGVALGSLGWNFVVGKADLFQNVAISLAVWLSAALACWLFMLLRRRQGRTGPGEKPWTGYSLLEIAGFSVVLAILSPAFHHVAFVLTDEEVGLHSFFLMALGDFSGAMALFLVLNVTASCVIHFRASRSRGDKAG